MLCQGGGLGADVGSDAYQRGPAAHLATAGCPFIHTSTWPPDPPLLLRVVPLVPAPCRKAAKGLVEAVERNTAWVGRQRDQVGTRLRLGHSSS